MKKILFLFIFNLISFVAFSQNVTVTADKTTMSEAETTTFTATLSAVSSEIVTVNLTLGGTTKADIDYTLGFTSKGDHTNFAGNNGSGSNLNQFSSPNGIHIDDLGNAYISDSGNSRIIKWVYTTNID